MDLKVNKPFKVHFRKQFEEWYANEMSKQGPDLHWQAVSLRLSHLREEGAESGYRMQHPTSTTIRRLWLMIL